MYNYIYQVQLNINIHGVHLQLQGTARSTRFIHTFLELLTNITSGSTNTVDYVSTNTGEGPIRNNCALNFHTVWSGSQAEPPPPKKKQIGFKFDENGLDIKHQGT
jgi:hypothetical protein